MFGSARRAFLLIVVLIVALIAGCQGSSAGVLVGESAHFRLFIDPALGPLPSADQVSADLSALETDWADKKTMLGMPEGTIDYHVLTFEDVVSACGTAEFGMNARTACAQRDRLEVDAEYLPHQHELIHAYMALLSSERFPISLVTEGAAQAIGCNGPQTATLLSYDVPWQEVVTEEAYSSSPTAGDDVYTEGGLMARYLIRTQGSAAFVRYYLQAPEIRDPAIFAANFEAFWNMRVDDVWTAMHVQQPGEAASDQAICPCSLPSVAASGDTPAVATTEVPYWTLPELTSQPIAFVTPPGSPVLLQDCAGLELGIESQNDANVFVTQLASAAGLYVRTPLESASVAPYLAQTCPATAPFELPADFSSGPEIVSIVASRTTTGSSTAYLQINSPSALTVAGDEFVEFCGSCAFDQGSCQAPSGSISSFAAQGTFYVKLTFLPLSEGDPNPGFVTAALQFSN